MITHLTLSVRKRRTLVRSEDERRVVVRLLARLAGPGLLLFNVMDDHVHLVTRTAQPGRVGRSILLGLRGLRPDLEFKRPHPEVVDSQASLRTLVRYVFQQSSGKDLGSDALWTGSSFQDLVGARRLPGLRSRAVLDELPRLHLREVLPWVAAPARPLEPRPPQSPVEAFAAASAACCAPTTLLGRTAPELRALRAAIALCDGRFRPSDIRDAVGRSRSSMKRLRSAPADSEDVRATGVRLALEGLS